VGRDVWLDFCDSTHARLLDEFLNWASGAHTARR
jgi:hypothetical protein